MSVLFDGVDLTVEVSFTPAASAVSWTDVTSFVQSLSFGGGRQRELERPEPGFCSVVFLNSDRRFDPYNTASPYYPNVLPMRQLRVRATYASVSYDLWRGYVNSWSQDWQLSSFSTCTVECTDIFRVLAGRGLQDAYWYVVDADSPVVWLRLGESEGSLVKDEISGRFGTMHGVLTGNESLVYKSSDGAISFDGSSRILHENTAKVVSLPLSVEFWVQTSGTADTTLVRQGSGLESDGFSVGIFGTGEIFATAAFEDDTTIWTDDSFNDGLVHHVVYVRTSSSHLIYVDGVSVSLSSASLPSGTWNGTLVGGTVRTGQYLTGILDEVAIYDTELTWADVLVHYATGVAPWDGDTTGERIGRVLVMLGFAGDLDSGNTVLGSAAMLGGMNAFEYVLLVLDTEFGNMWVEGDGTIRFRERNAPMLAAVAATLGDGVGEIPFSGVVLAPADELIRNEVTVEREFGVPVTVSDAGSQTEFLVRSYGLSGVLFDSDEESFYAADWILEKYKNPVNRVESVVVNPRHDPSVMFPAVLSLTVDSKVVVNVRPAAGAVISETSIIESVLHEVTSDGWVTTYQLSPADAATACVFDDLVLGLFDGQNFGY